MHKNIYRKYSGIRLSVLPTPLQRLDKISSLFNANIFCKRDDMTGFAFGGNKTRKLEFLVADASRKKADVLIGIGGIQSNFCRIASAAGAKYGFEVHLVLGGSKKPKKATGNLLLDVLFGAKTYFVESEQWGEWENYADELRLNLTKKGKRVYLMPIGGSSPVGALGYVKAFDEIMKDGLRMNVNFDYIMHATASAGTQSGLVVGARLNKWNGKIIGFGVSKNKRQLRKEIIKLSNEVADLFGVTGNDKDIMVDDGYMGEKYGAITDEGMNAVDIFARNEGILLDYVYSGKAASGLIGYLRESKFKKKENILFLHTGGNVHLFR